MAEKHMSQPSGDRVAVISSEAYEAIQLAVDASAHASRALPVHNETYAELGWQNMIVWINEFGQAPIFIVRADDARG